MILGTHHGSLLAFDVTSSVNFWSKMSCHKGSVYDMKGSTKHVVTCGKDRQLIILDSFSGTVLNRIWAGTQHPIKLAIPFCISDILLVASTALYVYDLKTGKPKCKLVGYSTPCTILTFVRGTTNIAFSAAKGDKNVAVWILEHTKVKSIASAVLEMTEPAISVVAFTNDQEYTIAITISDYGELYLWTINVSNASLSTHLTNRVRIGTEITTSLKSKDHFFVADFYTSSSVMIAFGSIERPNLERFEFEGKVLRMIKFVKNKIKKASEKIIENIRKNMPVKTLAFIDNNRCENYQILEERIEMLKLSSRSKENDSSIMDDSRSTEYFIGTSNLILMLEKAIKSDDHKLLEHCLGVRRERVILNTCRKLHAKDAITLLILIVKKISNRHYSEENLLVWLRAVIVYHAGSIMANLYARKQMMILSKEIEEKTSNYQNLLTLYGRLDFLITHFCSEKIDQVKVWGPIVSYEEPYSSDEKIETEDSFS
jgi:hypothetical protein